MASAIETTVIMLFIQLLVEIESVTETRVSSAMPRTAFCNSSVSVINLFNWVCELFSEFSASTRSC